jgi:asparagine synthase (glutamine-hydrolysing)
VSAICAIFRFDRAPVPSASIATLLGAMDEYGSEVGSWAPESTAQPVAMGGRPWRATREDAAYHPPLQSRDGRLVLVADARIDNRAELASQLRLTGESLHASDAHYILSAYEAWGRDCVRRLVGDFAFIMWDDREQHLFAARDAVGQRVLFYRRDDRQVALATTAHALAMLPPGRPRLNEQKVADFLVLLHRPEITFFEGIERLPPAHMLTASSRGWRLERWWSPWPTRSIRFGSDSAYVEAFRAVFEEAVRAQVRSAGDVGILLSGGLDSSSVAATAAAVLAQEKRTLRAYHAAPREGFAGRLPRGMHADETGDVAALVEQYPNIELHVHRPDGRSPFDDIERTFRLTGVLVRNASNAAWYESLCARAGEDGVRVLLSGHKGNGTISFTGVRSLRDALLQGRVGRVWREVHGLARVSGNGRREIFRDEVLLPLLPLSLAKRVDRWRGRAAPSLTEYTLSAIRPEFARAMALEARAALANRGFLHERHLSAREFRITILEAGADVFDVYTGYRPHYGVETRDPTADRRVVEYCFAIPDDQYLRDGTERWLVRRAMERRLPDRIRTRTTYGRQSADWAEWLPALRPWIADELGRLERHDTAQRCLDLPRMRALVDHWPVPLERGHFRDYNQLLMRGVMMGRYIRWFEESYG